MVFPHPDGQPAVYYSPISYVPYELVLAWAHPLSAAAKTKPMISIVTCFIGPSYVNAEHNSTFWQKKSTRLSRACVTIVQSASKQFVLY